jgi:outer membrane receptor protein involved in Fe transport
LKQEIQELNIFRARSFDPVAAATAGAAGLFAPTVVPAVPPIPTGGIVPPGPIPGSPRLEFISDLIFPFFRANVDKRVPRSHSSNPGLFVEHLQPVGERMRLRAGARADWVSTNVEESGRFTRFDLLGLLIAPDEAFLPRTPQEFLTFDPRTARPQLLIPLTQTAGVDLSEELGEKHYGLGSFYLNGEYDLNENWQATFGGGYAMRPPTLTELYSFNGPFLAILQRGGNFVFGNPNLHVPQIWQMDLGVNSNYGRFRGGAGAYYSWVQDHVTLRPLLPLRLLDLDQAVTPVQPVQFINTDLATFFGGEMYGEFDLNDYFTAFAVSSYVEGTDHTRRQSGQLPNVIFPMTSLVPLPFPLAGAGESPEKEPLPGIPPWDNRIGLRFHEPTPLPTWGLEFSARIVDEQDLVATTLREIPTPGFTTYDVRSFWQVNQNVLLVAGVENLTDKQYREHLDIRTGVFQPGINFSFGTQIVY